MINLVRCDDRLIHGQCMTRLVPHFAIKHIIVIDEFTAHDPTMRAVIKMIAMPGVKNDIFDVEGSIEPIKQAINDNVSTMIVFRFPEIAKVLYDRIPDLQKKLMIGPVQKRDDTIEVRAGTYVTREEVILLDELAEEKGVEIFFQVVPDMKRIEFADFKKTLK